jgi:predicted lipoprotein with Yx(FWY)xxD motif
VTSLSTATYGTVLTVGGTGPLAGAPLYMLSSDADGRLGCTTTLQVTFQGPLTCTGPESDLFNNVLTDEWPAFTTTAAPVAGPGVRDDLLGTVYRPGIGRQVTYAGHPLYLFDPASSPFLPAGEGFFETVAPLPPWHGLWDLVSAREGQPAPGPATIETETLPDGTTAVAAEEYSNIVPGGVAVTAYSFSRDHRGDIDCTRDCAVTWIPVLTTGAPQVAGGISAKDVGVVRRDDGTHQVTYKGKPLYLYSAEQAVFSNPSSPPSTTGTAGNGNGLHGPDGGRFSIITPS